MSETTTLNALPLDVLGSLRDQEFAMISRDALTFHREKWLPALRSGEYTQGKQYLNLWSDNHRFCCLGVMVDLLQYRDDVEWVGFDDHEWGPEENIIEASFTEVSGRVISHEGQLSASFGGEFFGSYSYLEGFVFTPAYMTALQKAGVITWSTRDFQNDDAEYSLARMNDLLGYTFEQIATVVEVHLLNLEALGMIGE